MHVDATLWSETETEKDDLKNHAWFLSTGHRNIYSNSKGENDYTAGGMIEV